jgi:hypothetical protein
LIYVVVLVGVALVVAVLAPFFTGKGGLLQAGASINSPSRLEATKEAVLKRYLEDEAAHKRGDLSRLGWEKRKEFLGHRYVDAARRLDYLKHVQAAAKGLVLLAVAFASFNALPARADVQVSARHLIILREGLDTVWGSYVFAVTNDGQEPAPLKAANALPKETTDWAPQEGIEPDAVKLAPEGGGDLLIDKTFPPGTAVITIGFKAPASLGHGELTLKPASPIGDLTVLTPRSGLISIDAPWLKAPPDGASPDPNYVAFMADGPLAAGEAKSIKVAGVPEGRSRYWMLGGGVAALLVLGAAGLAMWTRPRLTSDGAEAVLVG